MTESAPSRRTCPWCSATAADADTGCQSCGAALAQRESIADLQIPGVTSVDPALVAADQQPLHLTGPSPSQGVAHGAIAAAVIGGPVGLAALGGIAAVAAAEYAGARRPGLDAASLADLGKPSEAALLALEHLVSPGGNDPDPAPGGAGPDAVEPAQLADPWRDLPAVEPSALDPEQTSASA
jgi:hypothetical protein